MFKLLVLTKFLNCLILDLFYFSLNYDLISFEQLNLPIFDFTYLIILSIVFKCNNILRSIF